MWRMYPGQRLGLVLGRSSIIGEAHSAQPVRIGDLGFLPVDHRGPDSVLPMTADHFSPGDHLRVRRKWVYDHHGVYVGAGRVVEFGNDPGSGAKRQALVREVSLEDFQGSGAVKMVPHPAPFLGGLGMGLPEPDAPERIVHRARWLASTVPTAGKYHLIGSNCEHVANWCVTGWYLESQQVRRFIYGMAVTQMAVLLVYRRNPKAWKAIAVPLGVVGFIVPSRYHSVPYRWRELLDSYPGFAR